MKILDKKMITIIKDINVKFDEDYLIVYREWARYPNSYM